MRIVVTGGRHYADAQMLFRVLDFLKPERVAQGGAPGADSLALEWCAVRKVECVSYPADWLVGGAAAGPIRNYRMLDAERPNVVIAFPGNAGTRDCMRQARAMGLLVMEVAA